MLGFFFGGLATVIGPSERGSHTGAFKIALAFLILADGTFLPVWWFHRIVL